MKTLPHQNPNMSIFKAIFLHISRSLFLSHITQFAVLLVKNILALIIIICSTFTRTHNRINVLTIMPQLAHCIINLLSSSPISLFLSPLNIFFLFSSNCYHSLDELIAVKHAHHRKIHIYEKVTPLPAPFPAT